MAVLRPDQAQLTFAAEVAAGADSEDIQWASDATADTTTFAAASTIVHAGSSSMTVTSAANFTVGDFIAIGGGNTSALSHPVAAATKPITHSEVRRLEHKEGNVIYFDRPLAMTHHLNDGQGSPVANGVHKVVKFDGTSTNHGRHIVYVPGVYETVDTPDPAPTIEPRYFLGTNSKRNFTSVYTGQRAYQGALSGNVLLNGWPLRFPIGVEVPKFATVTAVTDTTDLVVESYVGDIWVKLAATHGLNENNNDYLIVDYVASPDLNSITEIRKVKSAASSNGWVELETPLKYAHAATALVKKWNISATNYVEHHLVERTDLDSISMHLTMRDSGETALNDFDRRWVGGKVGAMTILGEEGGLVSVNWDSLLFKDMLHNQARHAGTTRYDPSTDIITDAVLASTVDIEPNMPGFALMNDISSTDISFPNTEPYYFSGGVVKLFGIAGAPTEFARIRSFAISVNNNEDQRFYIQQRYGDHKGPSEIREQRREYTMSCTVALPDTKSNTDNTIDNALTIFKELLLEGRYDQQNRKGFNISLKFTRESSAFGSNPSIDDVIYIDIPGPTAGATTLPTAGTPATVLDAVGKQGAFLRSAPHTIMTEAPFQVQCDFVFRNLSIVIRDQEPVYP